jgi:hypothetical protein
MKKRFFMILVLSCGVLAACGMATAAVMAQGVPPIITTVEPTAISNQTGGVLTVLGSGFTTTTVIRVVGYGILSTEFVNEGAVRATVPVGIPAGIYDLIADNGANGGTSAVRAGALQITAPPAPTAAPATPVPGKPNLTIRNYSLQPAQVRAGQEFVVTLEIYNNGSRASENTLVVFQGGPFVPVGQAGYQLWQLHINATAVITQRLRAPASMASGVQNLQVNLSGNDFEGNHYEFPQTIGVEVLGTSGGGTATGAPKLVIEAATVEPAIIGPGNPFTLTLRLTNRGSRTATNVVVGAGGTLAIPAQGSNVVSTPNIGLDKTVTVTLALILGEVDKGGRQALPISMQYSDPSGGNYTDQQNVGLDINTSLANRPQLLIQGYEIDPPTLSPGDHFTLTLKLTNVGGGDAQRLLVALGGEAGDKLEGFVPAEASNVRFLAGLPAGTSVEITQQLIVDGKAEPKAYNVPVSLAYDDTRGNRKTETQRISLMVLRRPEFKVSFYRPVEGSAMVGMPFQLPIELVNIGANRINVTTLEATSEQLMIESGSTFVGNMESGASWTLDAMGTAQQPGPAEVVVAIHYQDDFNQTQIITQTLTVEVMEAPFGPEGPGGENGQIPEQPETTGQKVLRFLRGLLGLGS